MADTFWTRLWRVSLESRVPGPDESTWGNDIDRRKLRFLSRHAPSDGVAAEVGCGSARLLARIGRSHPALRLIAVDESAAALQLTERTAAAFDVSIRSTRATAFALPFRDNSLDLVLSGGLLEHFPEPTPVLAEMLRVLRPGGVFYADVVPRKRSWYRAHEAERMRVSEYMEDGVYESSYGPAEYEQRLRSLGCKAVHGCWCGVYPWRLQNYRRSRGLLARASELFDGTSVATRLGWYFMLLTVKPGRAG
jgi:SAM-dependent methyltransferase